MATVIFFIMGVIILLGNASDIHDAIEKQHKADVEKQKTEQVQTVHAETDNKDQ